MDGTDDPTDAAESPEDLERIRQLLARATEAAFRSLERAPNLRLELSAQCAWILFVELQRSWHHTRGYNREIVERVARQLQAHCCVPETVLEAVAIAGWLTEDILPVVSPRPHVPEVFRRGLDDRADDIGSGDGDPTRSDESAGS